MSFGHGPVGMTENRMESAEHQKLVGLAGAEDGSVMNSRSARDWHRQSPSNHVV